MFFTAETARAGAAVIPACTHHTDGTSVWRTDKFQEGLVKMQGWNFSWERRQMTDDYMAWTRWHLLSLQSDITIFTSWRHSALFLLQRTITKQNCIAMRVTQTLALYKALQRAWIKYKNEGKKNKKKSESTDTSGSVRLHKVAWFALLPIYLRRGPQKDKRTGWTRPPRFVSPLKLMLCRSVLPVIISDMFLQIQYACIARAVNGLFMPVSTNVD